MKKSTLLFCLLFASVLCALSTNLGAQTRRKSKPASAQPSKLTPRQIAARIAPAHVSIYTLTRGRELYSGSGFFISPRLIATCYHVIEDASIILVKLNDERRPSKGRTPMGSTEGSITAKVYKTDADHDLAVLSIAAPVGKPLKLFFGEDMYIGEEVYTIGDPNGLEGTFSSGLTSNFQEYEDGSMSIQFTAPVSPGSSGGALVNDKAEAIGIVNKQYSEGQSLNFEIPTAYLRALVNGIPMSNLKGYVDGDMSTPKPKKRP